MLPQTIHILFFTVNTYTFLLAFGFIISLGISALTYRLNYTSGVGTVVDGCLAGLGGAFIMGRIGHVLIHWDYFSEHTSEIVQISAGGLNWHVALVGGFIGFWLMKTIVHPHLNTHLIIESWAWAIPLLGWMGWWACSAFYCGYGAEINNLTDYPSVFVWEAPAINGMMAPRFATHPLGMLWAVVVFSLLIILTWRGWLRGQHFGVILIVWSVGMFLLGYLRGDNMPMMANIRIDQWLDGMMMIIGAGYVVWYRKPINKIM
jgi:phosphatidylglycerol---prolipoprotein diacylglyceryl transferase